MDINIWVLRHIIGHTVLNTEIEWIDKTFTNSVRYERERCLMLAMCSLHKGLTYTCI